MQRENLDDQKGLLGKALRGKVHGGPAKEVGHYSHEGKAGHTIKPHGQQGSVRGSDGGPNKKKLKMGRRVLKEKD